MSKELSKQTLELIEEKVEKRYNSQMDLGGYIEAMNIIRDCLTDPDILSYLKGGEWVGVNDRLPKNKQT